MERRCLNCMNNFMIPTGYENDNNICPFCGFVENTPASNLSYMNPGCILKNRYIIGTVVGAGGFGITYKAWDSVLENIVAIKEYFPRGGVSRNGNASVSIYENQKEFFLLGRDRFLTEARSLAKFNSNAGTVVIHDFFEANNTAYIVMEYLDGWNLKVYTEDMHEKLSQEMIYKMIETICGVLDEVHSVGLIHRDISLDNIFLCSNGHFKLIDFGAVKHTFVDSNLSSAVVLKHGYAPIEQYSKNGNIGPWTDVYAFAATIYKLLTDTLPPESVDRLTFDELVDLRNLNPNVPQHFSMAIMKALSIQIQHRYQSIAEFQAEVLADIQILQTSQLIQGSNFLQYAANGQGELYQLDQYSQVGATHYSEILVSSEAYQEQLKAKLSDPVVEKKTSFWETNKIKLLIAGGAAVVLLILIIIIVVIIG